MYPNPFPFTLYNVTVETPTPPSPTEDYCYGGDWVQGYVGNYGMEFDGTDEYITTPTATDIEFGNDSTFTIACWVSSSQGSLQGFVSKATQALPNNNGWNMGRTMGSFFGSDNVFFASVRSGANYGFIFSDAFLSFHCFHYFCHFHVSLTAAWKLCFCDIHCFASRNHHNLWSMKNKRDGLMHEIHLIKTMNSFEKAIAKPPCQNRWWSLFKSKEKHVNSTELSLFIVKE